MKNIAKFLLVGLCAAFVGVVTAQTVTKEKQASLSIPGSTFYGMEDHKWRVGVALPVGEAYTMDWFGNPASIKAVGLIQTETGRSEKLFLGGGVAFPVYQKKYVSLDVGFGWSGRFTNLQKPDEGQWGWLLNLGVRF